MFAPRIGINEKGASHVLVEQELAQPLKLRSREDRIVGYTLWNWVFVYLNYPELAGHHVAVLSAALTLACLDRGLRLQARAASLGLTLLLLPNNYGGMLACTMPQAGSTAALGSSPRRSLAHG